MSKILVFEPLAARQGSRFVSFDRIGVISANLNKTTVLIAEQIHMLDIIILRIYGETLHAFSKSTSKADQTSI